MVELTLALRRVRAGRGFSWITEGFRFFARAPLMWVLLVGAAFLAMLVLSAVPFGFGAAAVQVVSPAVLAGFMVGCRAIEEGEDLEIEHLLAGFRAAAVPLVGIGVLYLAGNTLAGLVMHAVGGDSIGALTGIAQQKNPDPAEAERILGEALPAIALGLAILVPFAMATWFAPLLVVFDRMDIIDALRTSVRACLVNMWPLLVYGVGVMLLLVLALVPFGLGLIVLGPVLVASFYTAYRDVFRPAPEMPAKPD